MIITNWTMRRFHIASFLVLFCARLAPGLPAPTTTSTRAQQPATEPGDATPTSAGTNPAKNSSEENEPPTIETAVIAEPPLQARTGNGEEGNFFQGDIRLTATSDPYDLYSDLYRRVFKRMAFDREGSGMSEDMLNSTSLSAQLWPGGRIPFVIDGSLPDEHRSIFTHAIAKWEEGTCVRFERINDFNITEEDYLVLTNTAGCSSYVGKVGGRQQVSIDNGCMTKGHAMHELGHAIGLWHEHSRWDRNQHIRIVQENINENAYYNFGQMSREKWSHIPDVGYDLQSIMHYEAKAFSKNDKDTIEVVVTMNIPDCAIRNMGQRRMLSRRDKLKTSKMYHCENETQRAERDQAKCEVETYTPTPTTTPTPTPATEPPTNPPTNKLLNGNTLRLNTNSSQNESLHCTDTRCTKKQCTYNLFADELICDTGFDFSIHHIESRKNPTIKDRNVIALKSLHKSSRWVECSGQNICSISNCHTNDGNVNSSEITQCEDQTFQIIAFSGRAKRALKDGDPVKFKHASNDTYLYCTAKWCDVLPECSDGEDGTSSETGMVSCHAPTKFYIQKLYG